MIGNKIDVLFAGEGYDADAVREALDEMEVEAVITSKSSRKQPIEFDREAYIRRNLIERMFNKLKNGAASAENPKAHRMGRGKRSESSVRSTTDQDGSHGFANDFGRSPDFVKIAGDL